MLEKGSPITCTESSASLDKAHRWEALKFDSSCFYTVWPSGWLWWKTCWFCSNHCSERWAFTALSQSKLACFFNFTPDKTCCTLFRKELSNTHDNLLIAKGSNQQLLPRVQFKNKCGECCQTQGANWGRQVVGRQLVLNHFSTVQNFKNHNPCHIIHPSRTHGLP